MRHGNLSPPANYEVQLEEVDGRPVVRARSVLSHSHMKVTLTFPLGDGAGLGPFKERVVRSVLASHR